MVVFVSSQRCQEYYQVNFTCCDEVLRPPLPADLDGRHGGLGSSDECVPTTKWSSPLVKFLKTSFGRFRYSP